MPSKKIRFSAVVRRMQDRVKSYFPECKESGHTWWPDFAECGRPALQHSHRSAPPRHGSRERPGQHYGRKTPMRQNHTYEDGPARSSSHFLGIPFLGSRGSWAHRDAVSSWLNLWPFSPADQEQDKVQERDWSRYCFERIWSGLDEQDGKHICLTSSGLLAKTIMRSSALDGGICPADAGTWLLCSGLGGEWDKAGEMALEPDRERSVEQGGPGGRCVRPLLCEGPACSAGPWALPTKGDSQAWFWWEQQHLHLLLLKSGSWLWSWGPIMLQ